MKKLLSLLLTLTMVLALLTPATLASGVSPFADVKGGDWYYDAVVYVKDAGLMTGTGRGFEPNLNTSRAMIWTILARMDGVDTAVTSGDWYTAAQQWAMETGISDGTDPNGLVTREQLVAMLYRFAQLKNVDVSDSRDLTFYYDSEAVSSYAVKALSWACGANIINGINGNLVPQGYATRAQVATMLYRLADIWELDSASGLAGLGILGGLLGRDDSDDDDDDDDDDPSDVVLEKAPTTLFDVSAVYTANKYTITGDVSLKTATDETYGGYLTDNELDDALYSAYTGSNRVDVRYYFNTDGVDISAYEDTGVLAFYFYSSAATTYTVEIGSIANTPDNEELQWSGVSMQQGWNFVTLNFSSASKPGSSTIDLTSVKRLRLFDTTHTADSCLISDVQVYHAQYLPGNTTGDAAKDVELAANAIKAGLTADYGAAVNGKYTVDVRVPQNATTKECKQQVLDTLEGDLYDYLLNVSNIYNVQTEVQYTGWGDAKIIITMEDAEMVISVTPNFISYHEQKVHLVDSLYSTEKITANIVLGEGDYQLDATGVQDCTATIQAALDDCAYAGGGTVWLPAGYYRVSGALTVPAYVTLRGDWQDPDTVSDPAQLEYGTILIVDQPDAADSLIYMGGSTAVRGLTIYYPEQKLEDVKEYAFAIYNAGQMLHKDDRGLHTIQDITLINAYSGVGICAPLYNGNDSNAKAEQTYILNVKGTFLNVGLYNFNSSDNGSTTGFTANASYWTNFLSSAAYTKLSQKIDIAQTSVTEDAIKAYTKANATGVHIGDLEGDYFSTISVDSMQYGIQVTRGARTTYYGDMIGLNITNCGVGLQFNTGCLSGFGVNVACSRFTGNETDLVNNSGITVKLAQVSYSTSSGSKLYNTADETLTDTIDSCLIPTYGAGVAKNLVIFEQTGSSFSDSLQATLNKVGKSGGGIVYLPAGHYELDKPITVPANTELRGAAGSTVKPVSSTDGGTVLEVAFGLNSEDSASDAAIVLGGESAGISGLILAFVEQSMIDIKTTGYGIYAKNADNCFIVNSSIMAFSHGILLENCDNYVITGVTFSCFDNDVTAKSCHGGQISRCLQNLNTLSRNTYGYWTDFQSGTDTVAFSYTSDYLDCIILDGSTDQVVYNWYAYRPHNSLTLTDGSSALAMNYGAGGARNTDYGALIVAEDDCTALSINSHQKNRVTVKAETGANIRAYNRLTLDGSKLVDGEDSYRSVGADTWTLAEPGDELLSTKATATGYDLTSGGTISWATEYAAYADLYDFSAYPYLALELSEATESFTGSILLALNGKEIYLNTANGAQILYVAMSNFGEDLTKVSANSFTLTAEADAACKVTSVKLLKTLPDGAAVSTPSDRRDAKSIVKPDNTSVTFLNSKGSKIAASEAGLGSATDRMNEYLWKSNTTKAPAVEATFDAVDISRYKEQGWIHFYLYLPEEAVGQHYRLELTSSGGNSANKLQYEFGSSDHSKNYGVSGKDDYDNGYYQKELTAGWNELWFPIRGALSTETFINFSAVNYIRFYVQGSTLTDAFTLYLDGFEIVMRSEVPSEVLGSNTSNKSLWTRLSDLTVVDANGSAEEVSLEEYGKTGYGLKKSNASGTVQFAKYKLDPSVNIVDYAGGYLHISVYVPDADSLAGLNTFQFELASYKKSDTRETQWTVKNANTQFKVGWNELYLPLTTTYTRKGHTDLHMVNYFKMFCESNTGAATLILADMYATMTAPESVSSGNLIVVK